MLTIALKNIQNNVLPQNTPIYLSEYGYSAYGGKAEVDIEGALMYADILGKFLEPLRLTDKLANAAPHSLPPAQRVLP